MDATSLCRPSAADIVLAVRSRQFTASHVMQCHLQRPQALEPLYDTYVTLDAEGALRAVHAVDRCIAPKRSVATAPRPQKAAPEPRHPSAGGTQGD